MEREPILLSIQTGLPADYGIEDTADPMESPWTTGFYKAPVSGPVFLARVNLDGDGQADLINHGGPDKAVCAYSADHYNAWRQELGLPDLPFGAFGENFTIDGLTENVVCVGDVWRVGEAVVQVSQPRQPCWKLARRWGINDLPRRVVKTNRTGWYFRVLEEGMVAPGLPMALLERSFPQWTIGRANEVMYHDKGGRRAAELVAVPSLSGSWRETLSERVIRNRTF